MEFKRQRTDEGCARTSKQRTIRIRHSWQAERPTETKTHNRTGPSETTKPIETPSTNSHIHLILPITLSLDGQNPMSQNPSAGAPVLGLPRHHLPVKIDPQLDQILALFLSVVGIKSPIVQLLLGPKQEQGVRSVMHPVRRTPFLHDETA